jgi:hypothetical protein
MGKFWKYFVNKLLILIMKQRAFAELGIETIVYILKWAFQ